MIYEVTLAPAAAGDYRIIYEIEENRLLVLVLSVGHRREIYQRR